VPGELEGPGDRLNGDVECVRGECNADSAVVVALEGFVDVVMDRGCDGEVVCVWCCEGEEGEGVALPCCMALCARKAARTLAKKGRWVGIVLFMSLSILQSSVGEEGEEIWTAMGKESRRARIAGWIRMREDRMLGQGERTGQFDPRCE
jgi:hypothetical protein